MLVNENKPLSNQASKSTLTYDRRTSLISEDECREPYSRYIQNLDCHRKEPVI